MIVHEPAGIDLQFALFLRLVGRYGPTAALAHFPSEAMRLRLFDECFRRLGRAECLRLIEARFGPLNLGDLS